MSILYLEDKWDVRFTKMAILVSTWSKDPDARVGAVIVSPSTKQLSTGYNGYVAGAADNYEGVDVTRKNQHTVHAELNAILNARANVEGWTLYVTKFPCQECAKAIIQAGVTRVVTRPPGQGKWSGTQDRAEKELLAAGVEIQAYRLENEAP
jgi:dCMP deaminase